MVPIIVYFALAWTSSSLGLVSLPVNDLGALPSLHEHKSAEAIHSTEPPRLSPISTYLPTSSIDRMAYVSSGREQGSHSPALISNNENAVTNSSKTPYFIRTKQNTPLSKFQAWIQELDGGAGTSIAFPNVKQQSYVTELTPAEAESIQALDFILLVEPHPDSHELDHLGLEPNSSSHRVNSQPGLKVRDLFSKPTSDGQLQFISYNKPGRPPADTAYVADDSEGEGTRIYVIDSGFDVDLQDFTGEDDCDDSDRVTYYAVPANLGPKPQNGWTRMETSIKNFDTHGTIVAAAAGGSIHGIAPGARLHLVKWKIDYRSPTGQMASSTSAAALYAALDNVKEEIYNDQESIASVVIIAWGSRHTDPSSNVYKALNEFREYLEREDVSLVCAAGNYGLDGETLASTVPQAFGTDSNNVITVGGVHLNGSLYYQTTPQGSGAGSMTVYGPSSELKLVGISDPATGSTSVASAIVGGLAAYFLGNTDISDSFTSMAKGVKGYLIRAAFQRVPCSQIITFDPTGILPYAVPRSVKGAYNGARGSFVLPNGISCS